MGVEAHRGFIKTGRPDWSVLKHMRETMKNILFATTALVASAGVAAADVSFSGSAGAGVFNDDAAGTNGVYSFAKLSVAMTGEADNGIKFGADLSVTAGNKFDTGDFEDDGAASGIVGFDGAYVEFGGAKLKFKQEGIDDLYDDDYSHDIQFDYSTGGFSISTTVDDSDTAGESQYSYKLAYSTNGITATLTGNDLTDNQKIDINYKADAYKVGIEYNLDGDVTKVYGEYTTNGFTVNANYATNDDWDFGVKYAANGITVAASTDESDAWELTGSYDLGGGLSAVAGYNASNDYYAGLAMKF